MAVALRVDDDSFQGQVTKLRQDVRRAVKAKLVFKFQEHNDKGDEAGDLLVVAEMLKECMGILKEAFDTAREMALRYPGSVMLREMCAGRDVQLRQLRIFGTWLRRLSWRKGKRNILPNVHNTWWGAGGVSWMDGLRLRWHRPIVLRR